MRQADLERDHPNWDGTQKLYRFDNGYGASVIQSSSSYGGDEGLWELAVIKYIGEGIEDFILTYETEITDDVLGYLCEDRVDALLEKIERL